MVQSIPQDQYNLLACAIGTGTMISGLLRNATIPVMGFSSLKLPDPFHNSITENIEQYTTNQNFTIQYNYHFGGFGKINETLISFMNELYLETGLPTDIVYTGKMLYGLFDMVKNDRFSTGTNILAIHSGGLQGNRSVKNGALVF
jgi:D-cysteine desulfhydrase